LGSYNHSHADNNAFTFVSKGKELLISGGYYPYYNSPHHALVNRATRFKNALTFDGGIGQSESTPAPSAPGKPVIFTMDGRGKLLNFNDDDKWAFTTGDATLAYRGYNSNTGAWTPMLSNALRSVGYNRLKGIVVIYDWATSDVARKWELNFQSLSPSAFVGQALKIVNGSSSACINIFGPSGSYSQTTGFPIAPEISLPTQAQSRFSVSTPSKELAAVTIIREDCREVSTNVTFTGRTAKIEVDGSVIEANGPVVQYTP
jgi:hypothetical protein